MTHYLQDRYRKEVVPVLQREFSYSNVMQIPRLRKVVLNVGCGEAIDNPKALEATVADITAITGQKPVVAKAKKSVANFKLRKGQAIGCRVTLRRDVMYEFFDRLVAAALPRIRDFRGVPAKSFDGRGNYSLGIREQLIFPEIRYDKVEMTRGMDICIATSARTDEEARALLEHVGFPFRK
jgi:large subunit ribosomal protein L5